MEMMLNSAVSLHSIISIISKWVHTRHGECASAEIKFYWNILCIGIFRHRWAKNTHIIIWKSEHVPHTNRICIELWSTMKTPAKGNIHSKYEQIIWPICRKMAICDDSFDYKTVFIPKQCQKIKHILCSMKTMKKHYWDQFVHIRMTIDTYQIRWIGANWDFEPNHLTKSHAEHAMRSVWRPALKGRYFDELAKWYRWVHSKLLIAVLLKGIVDVAGGHCGLHFGICKHRVV